MNDDNASGLNAAVRQPLRTTTGRGNEQYHALLATEARMPTLGPEELAAPRTAIEHAPYLRDDPDRAAAAERILGRPLSAAPAHHGDQGVS